ncbi:MAG: hypothetical protein ACLR3U_04650 [Christensenellaceae bacterium]|jgi:hypothetical protein|nr:hypothetical protein [Clostridia bacterium]PWL97386.1 MAG: hypothetical protein DBY05_12985 [Clostridiales bacterium]
MKKIFDKFIVAMFCSPQPPAEKNGRKFPNKITLEQYLRAKELGFTTVYGHNEIVNTDTEKYAFEALELAEKAGLDYLVKDSIAEEYISLGNRGYRPFSLLSEREKRKLDERFAQSLARYSDYPAFAGITFFDEPGSDSFEGIARAKKVFDRVCGDKLFYVNLMPYYITPEQYQYGYVTDARKFTDENYAYSRPNYQRYVHYLDKYIRTEPDVLSYDVYPYVNYGSLTDTIHEGLYDMLGLFFEYSRRYSLPFMPYCQAGGEWEGGSARKVTDAEMRHQINISLLFGARGIQFFPYCFPNDWLDSPNDRCGAIDCDGRPTDTAASIKKALGVLKNLGSVLIKSTLKGIMSVGEFDGKYSAEMLKNVEWSQTIFQGNIPHGERYMLKSISDIERAEASSQVLIGEFDSGFLLVNNSIKREASVHLKLRQTTCVTLISDKKLQVAADELNITLDGGDAVFIARPNQ